MARIYCFSGMGNSAAVAARLRELLPDDCADTVWVMPVYAWGVPPVVVRHLRAFPPRGERVHMVCTYGDETGNIDRRWLRLLDECGATAGGIYGVWMPNTYVCLPFFGTDSPELIEHKIAEAEPRIRSIAQRIAAGSAEIDIHRGPLPELKSRVIYPWFFNRLMKHGKFHATQTCVGCGRCAELCPVGNITTDAAGRPQWGANCAYCLRCYHVCNHHAVAYGAQTARKGQYLHPDFAKNRKNVDSDFQRDSIQKAKL